MYIYNIYYAYIVFFRSVREALLDLWSSVLELLDKVEDNQQEAVFYYRAIIYIIRR